MRRLPRKTNQPVVTKERAWLILSQGVFIAFCSLLAFSFVLFIEKEGLPRARTAAFIVLACSQLFHSFNCRSIYQSIFKLGIFSNIKLVLATFISFSLLVVAVYLPFAQSIFKTEALGAFDWCLVLAISSFPLWAEEIHKLFIRGRINTRGVSYAGN
jgi:Ca2+-transporting ATPase